MKEQRIPIAREGIPFILFAGFATLCCAVLSYDGPALVMLALTALVLYFFRDPDRVVPDDADALVSPADGKVILVEKVFDDRYVKEHVYKISIFMNIFDVHVNRAPCQGTVTGFAYRSGRFFSADTDRAGSENENCALYLENDNGLHVAVVQVAGLVAQRIVLWAEKGDLLNKGQRFGMIRFGSRVDLYLPLTVQVEVKPGQRVRAGETILGYFTGQ